MSDSIKYRKGYKYSLWETYRVQLKYILGYQVKHRLFELEPDGWLTIHEDYPWDGASGPTWDTITSMRASLVHDVLFEMMRLGLLPQDCFHPANTEFHAILIEDGMWKFRANCWFDAVEDYAGAAAALKQPKIYSAPD